MTTAVPRPQGSSTPIPGGDEKSVAKVTLFDPENKFVAFSGTFGGSGSDVAAEGSGIKTVIEAWGAVWVLTESGQVCRPITSVYVGEPAAEILPRLDRQLFRLSEQPLKDSFATLFQRNLFTLAIGLAQSRGLGKDEVADIYRR